MTMNRVYGYSQENFVLRKGSSDTFVLGGMSQTGVRWTRVLSKRAAHMLWFHLARSLFPGDADDVTASLPTALMRGVDMPSITKHIVIEPLDHACYEILGYTSAGTWAVQVTEGEARRLWEILHQAINQ